MRLTTLFEKHEYVLSFFIIFLTVTISNLHAVFGLDMLFLDDNARYYLFVNDQYKITDPRSFIGLLFLLKWIVVSIFGTYSVEHARLFILIVYMVPISCLFYFFNRNYLYLSRWVALASAVIINIIPRQFVIPTFIDGSYPLPGMFVFLATLIFASQYLKSSRTNILMLLTISIGWLLVCDLIAEMGIFLFPVLLYYIHSSEAKFNKKLYLYIPTLLITAYRLYIYFQTVGVNPTNKPVALSIKDITGRILHSIEWWLPFGKGTTTTITLGTLVIAMLVYSYILTRNTTYEKSNNRAYIFYGLWFVSCSFPFWFLSKYFGPRYFYISYFALTTITLIAAYQIFILPRIHKQRIALISLTLIFSLYGIQRYLMNVDQYDRWNKKNEAIYSLLSNETINDETQFALVNIKNGTGGYYMWSSGYLQYLLKKPGIRGIMGNEMNFYDPFNLKHCGYSHSMSCIDTNKELIAFKQGADYKTIRMTYFLQWTEKEKRDSVWTLYKTDIDNKLSIISNGVGINAYITTLSELNIDPELILWGNLKDQKSLDALI